MLFSSDSLILAALIEYGFVKTVSMKDYTEIKLIG